MRVGNPEHEGGTEILLERQGPSTIDSKDQVQLHTGICLLTPAGTLPHSLLEQRHTPLHSRKKPPHTSLSEPPKREQKQSKEARRSCGVSDLLTLYHVVTYKVHTRELCGPGTSIKKFKKFILF